MSSILSPVLVSLRIGLIATFFAVIIGTSLAYLLKDKTGYGKNILETTIILPMVLPPTIIGYGLLLILGSGGFLEGLNIVFTWWAGVIAATLVSIPLMYQNAKSGFLSIHSNYGDVGQTLGLSKWGVFTKIEVPLAAPALVSGIVLSFARAVGEFGATLMVAGNIKGKTQTIATAMYFAVDTGDQKTANILLIMMVVFCFLLIFSLNMFLKKKTKNTY